MPVYRTPYDIEVPERPPGNPEEYSVEQQQMEMIRCSDEQLGKIYFVWNYVQIYDNTSRKWIPFRLFAAQKEALFTIDQYNFVVWLKARQLGATWVVLAALLHEALYRPEVLAILFSKREDEAIELLNYRFKGMYYKLPTWMRVKEIGQNTKKEFWMSNGSRIKASSAGGSDSYAATFVFVDEADLVHESGKALLDLLTAVEPTVGTVPNGKLILLSRADKARPNSTFKRIYKAATDGAGTYKHIFHPWFARVGRDDAWYAEKKANSLVTTGTLDSVKEQYPSTPEEALAPPDLDRRFPFPWIQQCYFPLDPLEKHDGPSIGDSLHIYRTPEVGHNYIVCVDPAEGNINSDDSSATVFDVNTGEEMAMLSGKFEPSVMAGHVDRLGRYYFHAPILVERNNHGHTLISWWREHSSLSLIEGMDSTPTNRKYGWQQNVRTKPQMWSNTADMLRDEEIILHSEKTIMQLADISASTGEASEGNNDDCAVTVGLFCASQKSLQKKFLLSFV